MTDNASSSSPGERTRPRLLTTAHGELRLPAFLPDATRAVVRGLDSDDVRACGIGGVVINVFHLQNRPGISVIAAAGGAHHFMRWPGPILSDSGGFQVYSLLVQSPDLGTATRRGFRYRLERRGTRRLLTPAKCIQLQFRLGTDVAVCLDHCTHPSAPAAEQRSSVEHTVLWARACRDEFDRLAGETGRRPLLFAVVQGGADAALRRECAERLVEIGFDGYGFGGWPIGEDGRLTDAVARVAGLVPRDSIRWALGIGKPEHVVSAARVGYDLFDCVIPTRDARHGRLYVFAGPPEGARLEGREFYERLYPQDKELVRSGAPVDPTCDCLCCRTCSRGYLNHLFAIRDTLAWRLATIHNLRFYARLMDCLRQRPGV